MPQRRFLFNQVCDSGMHICLSGLFCTRHPWTVDIFEVKSFWSAPITYRHQPIKCNLTECSEAYPLKSIPRLFAAVASTVILCYTPADQCKVHVLTKAEPPWWYPWWSVALLTWQQYINCSPWPRLSVGHSGCTRRLRAQLSRQCSQARTAHCPLDGPGRYARSTREHVWPSWISCDACSVCFRRTNTKLHCTTHNQNAVRTGRYPLTCLDRQHDWATRHFISVSISAKMQHHLTTILKRAQH